MSLPDELQRSLGQLTSFAAGEQSICVRDGDLQLDCQLVELDRLGCAFTRLALASPAMQGLSVDGLKVTAEKLSARLTYLLEPISPIEIDAQGCVVQLRSNPPHKDTDGTTYYELLVSRDGEISLCRYSRVVGQARQSIAAEVTRAVLVRLASDFAAVAS